MFDTWRGRTVLIAGLAVAIGVVAGLFIVAAFGDSSPTNAPLDSTVATFRSADPPAATPSTVDRFTAPPVPVGRVPDVVGIRLSAAEQSLAQAGFLGVQEKDASPQGRTVLEKDNWLVVTQDPPAGTASAPTTVVVLALKKPTDDHVPGVLGSGVMPDVVCAELQTAQEVIRASKLYAIISLDGSGQGRVVVLDRDWVVVAQSIRPGTSPGLTTPIRLSVVKYGEPSGSSGCPT